MTLVLPRGVTGFWFYRDHSPARKANIAGFQTYCRAAARTLKAEYLAYHTTDVAMHFHRIDLRLRHHSDQISVLLNEFGPYAALAKTNASFNAWNIEFIDNAELAGALGAVGFVATVPILTREQLMAPVTAACIANLSRVERNQHDHWKPETVGEIIFNHWD